MISINKAIRFVTSHGNGVRIDGRHLVILSDAVCRDGRIELVEDWVAIRPGDVLRLADLRDVLGY